jgi:hypothetical protein
MEGMEENGRDKVNLEYPLAIQLPDWLYFSWHVCDKQR